MYCDFVSFYFLKCGYRRSSVALFLSFSFDRRLRFIVAKVDSMQLGSDIDGRDGGNLQRYLSLYTSIKICWSPIRNIFVNVPCFFTIMFILYDFYGQLDFKKTHFYDNFVCQLSLILSTSDVVYGISILHVEILTVQSLKLFPNMDD